MRDATFQRPMKGRLIVRYENGDEEEATDDLIDQFRLVDRYAAYAKFDHALGNLICDDDHPDHADTELNPLRHLVEMALVYPNLIDHPDNEDTKNKIQRIEKLLRAHRESLGEDG